MSIYQEMMSEQESRLFKLAKKKFKRGKQCKTCGTRQRPEQMTVDHIIPVYQGADPMDQDNWQVLCMRCHRSKTTKEQIEGRTYESEPSEDDTDAVDKQSA